MLKNKERSYSIAVFIRSGNKLENKKLIGNNAPYVEVTLGNETKKTSKLSDLNNPRWNETLKFEWKENENVTIPSFIKFEVKDDRTLLPSLLLGDYIFNFEQDKINKYKNEQECSPFCILYDGIINLNNCEKGLLDVQILFECNNINWLQDNQQQSQQQQQLNVNENENNNLLYGEQEQEQNQLNYNLDSSSQQGIKYEQVKKEEYEKIPDIALQKNEVIDDRKDEIKYNKQEKETEIHVLPTIHVKEQPLIIEKEIQYNKPVEIKETIIHKEKPIIIEQPIIKEKHEHYRETPQHIKTNEKIIKETIHEQDVGNLDQETLQQLREQKKQEFSNTTPIIQKEKEYIQLDTDIREMPTQIREKEVIYQQPVEIEKTNIEKIKPTVVENVLIEKEHVQQKLAPQVHVENTQQQFEGDTFFSKDIDTNLKIAQVDNNNNNINNNNTLLSDVDAYASDNDESR